LFGEKEGEASEIPEVRLTRAQVGEGLPAFRLLVEAGLAASNAEARRLIRSQGVRLDDAPLSDEMTLLTPARLAEGVKLALGRKRYRRIRLADTGDGTA
jgi:tyrosyl-tRNA synthetase